MKPYMIYSKHQGPEEAALLVIANTAREAKKVSMWRCVTDDWTDVAAYWLRRDTWLLIYADQKKLAAGIAHEVDTLPLICRVCETWGVSELTDGVCEQCMDDNSSAEGEGGE